MTFNRDVQPNWKPAGEFAVTVGCAAPAKIHSDRPYGDDKTTFNDLCQLAEEIGKDPLKMRLLTERVYQLLLDDLRLQRERSGNYSRLI